MMVSLNAIVRAPNTDQGRRTMGAKVGVRGGVERCGGLVLTLPGNHFSHRQFLKRDVGTSLDDWLKKCQ